MPRYVYISGPMTGCEEFNYPAFHEAAKLLAANGFLVLNPADNFGGATGYKRKDYMRMDFTHVLQADALYLLTGWHLSRGARAEVLVAAELGLTFMEAATFGGVRFVPAPQVETEIV